MPIKNGQLRRASCRRPLNRYPPAGRLEMGTEGLEKTESCRCHVRACEDVGPLTCQNVMQETRVRGMIACR